MSSMKAQTSILFQNKEKNVTLLDIPTSIAAANGFQSVLLSVEPLKIPYTIHNEPKSKKARDKHGVHVEPGKHMEYKGIINHALSIIKRGVPLVSSIQDRCEAASTSTTALNVTDLADPTDMAHDQHGTSWCLPRPFTAHVPHVQNIGMEMGDPWRDLEAQLQEWGGKSKEDEPFDYKKMMHALCEGADATSIETVSPWLMSYSSVRDHVLSHNETPWLSSFHNPHRQTVDLTVSANQSQHGKTPQVYRFKIPPLATFFLGDVTNPKDFRASFRELTEEFVLPRHFDFVLLDPPWPNSSVKRKGNYKQVGGLGYMKKILFGLDLDNYLEQNALVAIWITNSKATRDLVLGDGGLFEQWNVGLVEEWLWIKTTQQGQPIFSLDSLWRKPYEVLLVGRAAPNAWTTMAPSPLVTTRVIAAVPDLHSRKPCLKELIEPFMPDSNDYSALEVFGRHLVSGWTSWGNEVLKFNWEESWGSKID